MAIVVIGAVLLLVLVFSVLFFVAFTSTSELSSQDASTRPTYRTYPTGVDVEKFDFGKWLFPTRRTRIVCVYHYTDLYDFTDLGFIYSTCEKIVLSWAINARKFRYPTLFIDDEKDESRRASWNKYKRFKNCLSFIPPKGLLYYRVKYFIKKYEKKQSNGESGLAIGVDFSDPIRSNEQEIVASALEKLPVRFDFIMTNLLPSSDPCPVFPRWKGDSILSLYNWAKKSLTAPTAVMATAGVYRAYEKLGKHCVNYKEVYKKEVDCAEPTLEPFFTTTTGETYATETNQTLAEMWEVYLKAGIDLVFYRDLLQHATPRKCVTRNISDFIM